jgi:hypothetical protein
VGAATGKCQRAGILEGGELQLPAFPPERGGDLRNYLQVADHDQAAFFRVQYPHVIWGERKNAGQTPTVLGEEQHRVGRLDDLQLADVIPAQERDLNTSHRPRERM